MHNVVDVILWGTHVGSVTVSESSPVASFEYTPEFRSLGIEISPFVMPLRGGVYSFPQLPYESFHGLPGLVADSLPDKFGNAVIAAWLRERGKRPEDLNSVARLSYAGKRGMGALEYRPAIFNEADEIERVEVSALAELASRVLRLREESSAKLDKEMTDYSSILKVGSSAGGARAKALIGWNETTGEVRSGQVRLPSDFGYWLIKFDGLSGNGDKEGDDKWGYGRIEYAYHLMAKAAGIEMTECRLWNRRHFMTKRFDRLEGGDKLHAQTLGAIRHLDFNNPVVNSYEDALDVTNSLTGGDMVARDQIFRRMVFNVLAWNCDDHVKNISYLMDRNGRWTLAPAYDVCYAYNPGGAWTSRHQMSVNGKREGITYEDFEIAARAAGLRPRRVRKAVEDVRAAVADWRRFAETAEVREEYADSIASRIGDRKK